MHDMSKEMTISETLQKTVDTFKQHRISSARLDAELLLAHVLQITRAELYGCLSDVWSNNYNHRLDKFIKRRCQNEPLAYIVGYKEFYGLDFMVNSNVLIPRPETEILVEAAIRFLSSSDHISHAQNSEHTSTESTPSSSWLGALGQRGRETLRIIDVCTGSGCIGITLAHKFPQTNVICTDISHEALHVAKHNAQKRDVADRIVFLQGDLLEPVLQKPESKMDASASNTLSEPPKNLMNTDAQVSNIDCIVANPPYIRQEEVNTLPSCVSRYEPQQALIGESYDGLGHHRRILQQASHLLKPRGRVYLEISPSQAQTIGNIKQPSMQFLEILPDLSGLYRVAIFEKME